MLRYYGIAHVRVYQLRFDCLQGHIYTQKFLVMFFCKFKSSHIHTVHIYVINFNAWLNEVTSGQRRFDVIFVAPLRVFDHEYAIAGTLEGEWVNRYSHGSHFMNSFRGFCFFRHTSSAFIEGRGEITARVRENGEYLPGEYRMEIPFVSNPTVLPQ